jgi:hypothetical protein
MYYAIGFAIISILCFTNMYLSKIVKLLAIMVLELNRKKEGK